MRPALLALALVVLAAPEASAEPGQCLLEVNGKPYLLGRCNVDRERDGSFSIGTGSPKVASDYFAYLSLDDDGTAFGSWNGVDKYRKADVTLGKLTKLGGCWVSPDAKICAWK